MSRKLEVSRFSDFESLDRDDWNNLVAADERSTVFQTHEWLSAWWNVYADEHEPFLLCATEDGVLVGIAALALFRDSHDRAVARFMGHHHSDYSDIICAANRDDVRKALLSHLMDPQAPWYRMDLKNIPANSATVSLLESPGGPARRRCLVASAISCPTLLIHGHEDFFNSVRKKKSLRRHHNYFRKQPGYIAEHFRDAAQILPHLDAFFHQHIERWAQSSSPSMFNEDHNRRFYRAMVSALDGTDSLRFTRLAANGAPIAFHLGFAGQGRFIWYKPTFDPALARRSPGEALIKELLELAAEEGHAEFDFTVGNEAFKQRFTNHTRHNVRVAGYSTRFQFERQRAYVRTKEMLKQSAAGRTVLSTVRNFMAGN